MRFFPDPFNIVFGDGQPADVKQFILGFLERLELFFLVNLEDTDI